MDNDFTILGDLFLKHLKDKKTDEENMTYFKKMKEHEEELSNILGETELELFDSFKFCLRETLYELQLTNISKAINTGVGIGLQLFPYLNPDLLDE